MSAIFESVMETLEETPVIDTHEHLENEERHEKWNVLSDYTQHYFVCDLISSGLPPERISHLDDEELSIIEKWDSLSPWWERCRNTGYGQALDLAARKLYGVDEINRATIDCVEDGFQKLRAHKGFSNKLLRETCGIEYIMDNIWRLDGDDVNGLFRFVTQADDWVLFGVNELGLEKNVFMRATSIEDWAELCLDTLEKDFSVRGAVALKLALAYKRKLFFSDPNRVDAEAGYQSIRRGESEHSAAHICAAQDYIARKIMRLADEKRWIVQIHTGYQEGNSNILTNSDPGQLSNLLMSFPNVRFDLFHMGFPYHNICGALGKMFPNVRVNMCWTHMLSPITARNMLREWLYMIPVNKIFGFGGDCRFFDGTVGHLELAKRNTAHTLSKCVEDGLFSLKRAKEVARMLFYENPRDYYSF